MALLVYNKTTWATGDVITAEKLNNMESGIDAATTGVNEAKAAAEAASVVICTETNATLDKTYNELLALLQAGKTAVLIKEDSDIHIRYVLSYLDSENSSYAAMFTCVSAGNNPDTAGYVASDPDTDMIYD